VTKLAELNVPLGTHEVGMTADTQHPPLTGQQYLEITCNGMVCVVVPRVLLLVAFGCAVHILHTGQRCSVTQPSVW